MHGRKEEGTTRRKKGGDVIMYRQSEGEQYDGLTSPVEHYSLGKASAFQSMLHLQHMMKTRERK